MPEQLTVEEKLPVTPPREPTETRKETARQTTIHFKKVGIDKNHHYLVREGEGIEFSQLGIGEPQKGADLGWTKLSQQEFELLNKFPGVKGVGGKVGELMTQRQEGREESIKLQQEVAAYLQKQKDNANTEELRERAREQLERLGKVDPIVFEDLFDIYSNTAIAKSIASDIPGIALTTAGGAVGGSKLGGTGVGIGVAAIGGVAATFGAWQAGTAKGAASTSGEAKALGIAAVKNIERMEMNLRAGEPIAAFDDEGNFISDPVTAFNQEWAKILYADAQLTRIYGDEYFNLETGVGPQFQKVRGFVRDGARHQREFSKAIVEPPRPGSPELLEAQTAFANRPSSTAETVE